MKGLAVRHAAGAEDDPEAGPEVLQEIRATVRRLEILALERPGDKLLALAVLAANDAAAAAEDVVGRQVCVDRICRAAEAEGWAACEAAHAARRRHLHPV